MLSLATIANEPVTGLTRAKANVFSRPSILFRPHQLLPHGAGPMVLAQWCGREEKMVEPPGTAPGSDPVITRAFIAIVQKDRFYIGAACLFEKMRKRKKTTATKVRVNPL